MGDDPDFFSTPTTELAGENPRKQGLATDGTDARPVKTPQRFLERVSPDMYFIEMTERERDQ